MDVRETDKDITVHADLPGVKKDDVFVRSPLPTALSLHATYHARGTCATQSRATLP